MQIWGWKTTAMFDVWSIEHFIGGIMTGGLILAFCGKKAGKSIFIYLSIIVTLAYLWELIEYSLELGGSGIEAVTYWFQGVEYWGNRLITDPLLLAIGALIARKFNKLIKPASFVYVTWYMIHIFILQNAMSLQNIFG
jgi:hypothetical protein